MIENKYKPIPFWSWNDELEVDELLNQIEWMNKNGFGGYFMHARGGLTTPYLGEKWFKCIQACQEKGNELGMEPYAYDENGWPSGFVGGKLLSEKENLDNYLEFKEGPFDPEAFVSYDASGDKLIRVTSGEKCLNIYKKLSNSTVDICNPKVVKKFLDATHEEYAKRDTKHTLKGFFTDEPQYYRWGQAYTPALKDYFKENYNYDILDGLGLLFVEKEGYREFRYRYYKAMNHLMLNSFGKQIYDWCDNHGYKLTGHYVEENIIGGQIGCDGDIMPFYEYEHIPGMDALSRTETRELGPKQLGSVAAQLGKKQVLTETFALCGWDATPRELKHIAEAQFVHGVNLMCHHLVPYSEHGQRKRDYPEHYSKVNPWCDAHIKDFNDYFANLGKQLATSKELVNVGVLHPIRSAYFDYTFAKGWRGCDIFDKDLLELQNLLGDNQIPYHYINETLLHKHGKIDGESIQLGLCKYDFLVLPLIYTMDKETEAMLKEYVLNGGKILITKGKPTYLEGQPFDYSYLETNTSIEEIKNSQPFKASTVNQVRLTYREREDGSKFFYIVNLGEKTSLQLNGNNISLDKWESKIIDENALKNEIDDAKEIIHLDSQFDLLDEPTNYLTLDTVRLSKDGIIFEESIPVMGAFKKLLDERFQGDLYLKYEFDVKSTPTKIDALIENMNIKEVSVNGTKSTSFGSVLEKNLWGYSLSSLVKTGHNEIVIKINFFEKDIVYYALFGENVQESIKNCLVYDSTIEAIYLRGNFGVYGDIVKGKEVNTYVGSSFYLDKQKTSISNLITDGFPFFRGIINCSQKINVKSNKVVLEIPDRFQTIDLCVNGQKAGLFMFNNQIDISKYVKVGENNIVLSIVISNRNLLGPFHCSYAEEPLAVGPDTFEKMGTWKDGKSEIYRDPYTFVKNLI